MREPADAAARSRELVEHLARSLPARGERVVHDLGCGSGAMGRWLAPQLDGPQHWVLHDLDQDLLEIAMADPPGRASDGAAVTVEARRSDITRMHPADLSGATVVTASALLDMLTDDEMSALVAICAGPRCPVLLTLSVIGQVELTPPEPLDREVAAAFDAHQRRTTERGRLLGPDAVAFAVEEFRQRGAEVLVRPSRWRLGALHAELTVEWFTGWVVAASEQQPELAAQIEEYRRRRLDQLAAGELDVAVDHADLLVLPGRA